MARFETPQPISLILDLRVADVRILAAEREDTIVSVHPSDSARRDDVTAAESTRVEYLDGKLLVKAPRRLREWSPFGDGGSIDVDIELPAGSDLSGRTAAGGFRCTGSLGACELKSGAGEIKVESAARAKLATAGDITIERVTGEAELVTATGEVRVGEIHGRAAIRNSNGDIRVEEARGDLEVKAANGDIVVERARGSLTAKTANGHVRIAGAHRGPLVAATAAGHIEVGVAGGAAAWLDLDTRYGHVRNGLEETAGPGPAEQALEIRARTGFGDITIRREAHAGGA